MQTTTTTTTTTTITTTTTTTSVEGNLIDLSEKSHLTSCYFLLLLVPVPRAMDSL